MRAWILVALTGCYDLPKPECGFACGPTGECPSDYTCFAQVNRCVLRGSSVMCEPADGRDAGTDSSADVTAPQVVSQSPPPNAQDVELAVLVHAQFDEPVIGYSDQTFRVSRLGIDETGPVMYDAESFTVVRQFPALLPDTSYTVTVTPGITDAAGNGSLVSWSFRTVDTRPPTVIMRAPLEDATGVSVGADITAEFSEPVMGVDAASFTVTQGGAPVTGTISYTDIFGSRATFDQTTQLLANTTYTVNLTSAIQDKATTPNTLAPVTWSFTTGADTIGPRVALTTPPDLAIGVAASSTITVQFDEPVQNVSTTTFTLDGGAITGTIAVSGSSVTFTPDAPLPANATIAVDLTTAITDATGNALAAPIAFSFMTAP